MIKDFWKFIEVRIIVFELGIWFMAGLVIAAILIPKFGTEKEKVELHRVETKDAICYVWKDSLSCFPLIDTN